MKDKTEAQSLKDIVDNVQNEYKGYNKNVSYIKLYMILSTII